MANRASDERAARPSRARVAVWALIAAAIVYAVGAGGAGSNGINQTWGRIAGTAVIVVALAAWLVAAVRNPFWRPRTALAFGFAAALGSLVISLLGSAQPRVGFDYIGYAILLTGGYLVIQRLLAHPFYGPRLGTLSVLLGIGLSGIYIAVVAFKWVLLWVQLGRVISPPLRPGFESLGLGDPSGLATVLLLLFLASVAHLGLGTTSRRRLVVTHGVLAAIAIFLTGSRSAWVGLAAAIAIVGLLWLASRARRAELVSLARSRPVQRMALVSAVAVAIGAVVFAPGVASRIGEPAADTRTAFAHASLAMFASDPLTGVGPGMWTVERIRFTQPPDVDYYIPHAHNLILQTMAEQGLVGAAAGLVVAALLLRMVVRGMRSGDPLSRRLAWATLFGGVYLVIHQLFGLYANMPAIWLAFALVVARLDALQTGGQPSPTNRAFAPQAVALVAALAGATLWLAASERASLVNDGAVQAADAGDWTAAEASARTALDEDSLMPPYVFTLGLTEAHTGQRQLALAHLQASAEIDDFPIAWLDVARLELGLGHRDQARSALAAAMRLGVQEPLLAFNASLMYDELGERSLAVAALAAVLQEAPSLASDPWWQTTGDRSLLHDAIDAALAGTTPEVGYLLALEAGRPQEATAIVAAMPAIDQEVANLVVRAWAGDSAAFETLHAMAVGNPFDLSAVALCRRLARHSVDELHLASPWVCDRAGSPDSPVVIRIGVSDYGEWAPVPGLPGPDYSVHDIYAYRRLAPLGKLVPGLIVVVPQFK